MCSRNFQIRCVVPKTPTSWIMIYFTMCASLLCFKWTPCPLILHQNVELLFLDSLYSNLSLTSLQTNNEDTKLLDVEVNTKCNTYYIEHKAIYFSSNLLQDIWLGRKDLEINSELSWNSSLREFKGIFPGCWEERNVVQYLRPIEKKRWRLTPFQVIATK